MNTGSNARNEENDIRGNDIVLSKTINAGKRIYYLDVKQNRKGELFLVITESKKIVEEVENHSIRFEKHKVFLYKEDFDKFTEALTEALVYIKTNNTVDFVPHRERGEAKDANNSQTIDIDL